MSEDAVIRQKNVDMSTIQKDMDIIKNMNDVVAILAIKTSTMKKNRNNSNKLFSTSLLSITNDESIFSLNSFKTNQLHLHF